MWNDIGVKVLESAYKGYNVSLFAYGQTGAGKSYSMMGYPATPLNPGSGIIPVACDEIFKKVDSNDNTDLTYKVECSMLEIYMEKVRDLFAPEKGNLKVRELVGKGFYVQDLAEMAVTNFEQIEKLMDAGTKARTIAATNMNATSSRAHTIFVIKLTQTTVNRETAKATDKVSLINLIDLAGSERQSGTGAEGLALKQGCAINQSLSALGNVISALAKNDGKSKVPYRSSVLTQLLKNSLGGNAKTYMIAALSPASVNYKETLSTLRYADRAKQIKNKAVVNEDPNVKMIRSLQEEIAKLKAALGNGGVLPSDPGAAAEQMEEIKKQIEAEKEREIAELKAKMEEMEKNNNMTWEERVAQSQNQIAALQDVAGAETVVDETKKKTEPYLVNLHEDIAFDRKIYHFIDEGDNTIGRAKSDRDNKIKLGGIGVQKNHGTIIRNGDVIKIKKDEPKATMFVNGVTVKDEIELHNYDRVILGNNHIFLFIIPTQDPPENADSIDYDFSLQEANAAAASALTGGGGATPGNDEEMQKRIKDMEAKADEEKKKALEEQQRVMKEMEEKMKAELESKEKEMREKHMAEEELKKQLQEREIAMKKEQEEKLKEQAAKQKELEEKLQKQMEETEKLARREKKRKEEKSLLDEKIVKAIPLVNEANSIAEELGKNISFYLKLISVNMESVENETVQLYVLVNYGTISKSWVYEDFVMRLYDMRELYNSVIVEGEKPEDLDMADPFVDDSEQFIGKATIYTQFLYNILPIDDPTPLVDYSGKPAGDLVVVMEPYILDKEGNRLSEDDMLYDNVKECKGEQMEIVITISGCRGLPKDFATNTRVQYKWFLEDDYCTTEVCEQKTLNPKFSYSHSFKQPITDDFIRYLEDGCIVYEVYGKAASDMNKTSVGVRASRSHLLSPNDLAPSGRSTPAPDYLMDLKESIAETNTPKNFSDDIPVSEACVIF